MKPIAIFLSIFILCNIISCIGNDEILDSRVPINSIQTLNCVNTSYDEGDVFECAESSQSNVIFCEIHPLGRAMLSEKSKSLIPQYCNALNSIFTFRNSIGEVQLFRYAGMYYTNSKTLFGVDIECDSDTSVFDRSVAYCLDVDAIQMDLVGENVDFDLRISMRPIWDRNFVDNFKYYDELRIFRSVKNSNIGFLELGIITNPQEANISSFEHEEFYDGIVIQGEYFRNVWSQDTLYNSSLIYKFYYSREFGLVAFRDANDTIWKLI